MATVVKRNPKDLKNYPLAIQISAEKLDPAFVDNIRHYGIDTPLVVCKSKLPELDGHLVKGHRRRMAAIKLDLKEVPTVEWKCDDIDKFELSLILDNITNERTAEERLRMAEHLMIIKKRESASQDEKARRKELRKLDDKISDVKRRGRPSAETKRNIRKEAADAVGMSEGSVSEGLQVVHAADELRNNGHSDEADSLLDQLNNGSIRQAVTTLKISQTVVSGDEANLETEAINRPLKRLLAQMTGAEKTCSELFNAFDKKKDASKSYAQRHKRYETMMREVTNSVKKSKELMETLSKAWDVALKQLEE